MPDPVSPLNREHWLKSQKLLARVLRGEAVPAAEILDGKPGYACPTCRDTAFVIETALDGTSRSRRCSACRARVDAAARKNKPGIDDIPDDPAPGVKDWKQAAGLDGED